MKIPDDWIREPIPARNAEAVIKGAFRFVGPEGISYEQFSEALPSEEFFEVEEMLEIMEESSEIRLFISPDSVPAEKLGGWGLVLFTDGCQQCHRHLLMNPYSTRHPLESSGSSDSNATSNQRPQQDDAGKPDPAAS